MPKLKNAEIRSEIVELCSIHNVLCIVSLIMTFAKVVESSWHTQENTVSVYSKHAILYTLGSYLMHHSEAMPYGHL